MEGSLDEDGLGADARFELELIQPTGLYAYIGTWPDIDRLIQTAPGMRIKIANVDQGTRLWDRLIWRDSDIAHGNQPTFAEEMGIHDPELDAAPA